MGREHRRYDSLQVLFYFGGHEPAQTIISAQRNDNKGGLVLSEQTRDASRATGCGLAADTGVDDTMRIACLRKARVKQTRPSIGERDAIARTQTVAKN